MGVAAPQICGSELVTASLVKLSREEVYQVGTGFENLDLVVYGVDWIGFEMVGLVVEEVYWRYAALYVQELAWVGLLV